MCVCVLYSALQSLGAALLSLSTTYHTQSLLSIFFLFSLICFLSHKCKNTHWYTHSLCLLRSHVALSHIKSVSLAQTQCIWQNKTLRVMCYFVMCIASFDFVDWENSRRESHLTSIQKYSCKAVEDICETIWINQRTAFELVMSLQIFCWPLDYSMFLVCIIFPTHSINT